MKKGMMLSILVLMGWMGYSTIKGANSGRGKETKYNKKPKYNEEALAYVFKNKKLHADAYKEGDSVANNKWRNFAYAKDFGEKLSGADLKEANFTGANFTDANLTGAILTNADLTNAKLIDANLTDANLTDANLTGAVARLVNFTNANLTNADFTNAKYVDNNRLIKITKAWLTSRGAKNVDTVKGIPEK